MQYQVTHQHHVLMFQFMFAVEYISSYSLDALSRCTCASMLIHVCSSSYSLDALSRCAYTVERDTQLANMHGALFLKAIAAACVLLCLSTTCLGELCGRASKHGIHMHTFGTHSYNHYYSLTPQQQCHLLS